MDKFTEKGILENALEDLWREQIHKRNKDITIVVTGSPGTGKSALSFYMMQWAASNLENVEFNMDHISFGHEQWMDKEKNDLPDKAGSWYDEGRDTFNVRRAMHNENKDGLDHLNQNRFRNLFRVINYQNMYTMEPELWANLSEVVIRAVKQGWAWVYSQRSIDDKIEKDADRKVIDWGEPDIRVKWANPAVTHPKVWDSYEETRRREMDKKSNKQKEGPRTVTCQKCENVWEPRVDVPRQCPECQTRNWNPRVGA